LLIELQCRQARTKATTRVQFRMGANLNPDDAAMLHDHNAVSALHRGQAVGNQQRGAVLHGACECGFERPVTAAAASLL